MVYTLSTPLKLSPRAFEQKDTACHGSTMMYRTCGCDFKRSVIKLEK